MDEIYNIGIDIGGQTAKIGLVSGNGEVLSRAVIPSNQTDNYLQFIAVLAVAVRKIISESKRKISKIGIGVPNGNFFSGCIEDAVNLTWGKNVQKIPVCKLLSQKLNIPVVITNDAAAAALGEMKFGVAKGMRNFIEITIGTGFGAGIMIDGKIMYGHDGFAGELGHSTFDYSENARLCGCGKRGCLETVVSAGGIVQTANNMLAHIARKSILRDFVKLTPEVLYQAACKNDEIALQAFNFTGKVLGQALANFAAFSAPEAIVLFGGLTNAKEFLYHSVNENFNKNLLHIWRDKIPILFSSLNQFDAAILGAAGLYY
jgi:glucokinase